MKQEFPNNKQHTVLQPQKLKAKLSFLDNLSMSMISFYTHLFLNSRVEGNVANSRPVQY